MAEQYRIWRAADDLGREILQRHRPELSVDQLDPVTIVDERAADTEQAEWRQLLLRDTASDCRMGNIHQKNMQCRQPVLSNLFVSHDSVEAR